MIKLFEKTLGNSDAPRHDHVKSTMSLPEFDLDHIKKSFQLEKIGAERGASCQPSSDSETYDDVEQKIISEIEREAKKYNDKIINELNEYNDSLKSLGYHALSSGISGVSQSAQSDFKASVHNGANHIYASKKTLGHLEK